MDPVDAQHPTSSHAPQEGASPPPFLGDADLPPLDPEPEPKETRDRIEPAPDLSPDEADEPNEEPAPAQPGEKPAADSPPSKTEPKQTFPTHWVIGICVFVFFLLLGATFLWKAHSDLGTLRSEVAVLRAQSRRAQVLQERATILRVRAELQSLRLTLPPELALEVDKADAALSGVDDRLKASQ